MSTTNTDAVISQLLSRPLPPLEPGTKIYSPELTQKISKLTVHDFVKGSKSLFSLLDMYKVELMYGRSCFFFVVESFVLDE